MVSFIPETLFFLGKFPFTNTLFVTLLIDVLILVGLYFLNKNKAVLPNLYQNSVEYIMESFYTLTLSISPKYTPKIFPWFMSLFLFIFLSNWAGLLPGFGTIGFFHGKELIPLFRSPSSDINFTLGLALLATVVTHYLSISTLGIKEYLSRYFSFNPIYLFVGLLELLSILTNVISLSFRLFGNIYAGDVVLTTISSILAFLVPLPFIGLEMIVGLVQALVFAMLTMAFMAILTTPHTSEGERQ